MQHSILVVDDEKDIVDSLERQLRKSYQIFKATSGIEALRVLQTEDIHLILSDQRMPEMTGVQLFQRAQKIKPEAIRILLTGFTDVESVIAAINTGQIYRYVTKPWDPNDLDVIVRRALEAYDLRAELKEKNQKLQDALTELKTLDQAKSHFMLLIGHELKTPLTTISSFLDLLKQETASDNDAQKYIQRVSQGADRLQEIAFDVLDIMQAETGNMKLKKQAQDLSDAVAAVLADFNAFKEKKSIKINWKAKSYTAHFDKTVITKVLKKIVHNALKFAPDDSEIEIVVSKEAEYLKVRVVNEGPKIPKDRIERIMKPFSLDEDIMHHSQGLGLGLPVSQSLLRSHGSRLIIDSTSGRTEIGFDLPLK